MRAIAEEGPVLVLVDQLDALADLVVQHSARLRVLLNLIRDLEEIPNVHVVASCRAFEQRHDPSLRNLQAVPLTLELPHWDAVDVLLQSKGVQAGAWNLEMRETLRSPHALDTFLSLLGGTDELTLASGFQGMLQAEWERKVLCDASGGRKGVLLDLAERMAEREVLWFPLALFEERRAVVRALLAAGLLITEGGGGRIAFRHQTLYEFVRARSFLDADGRLTETVLARQGSVRIRPQVWHALVFLRRVAPEQYQNELRQLWAAELRRHLRMLLVEFLGAQSAPLVEEVRVAFQRFDDPWFQPRFLSAVVGSSGWFEQLQPSYLPMLMVRSAQEAAMVFPILDGALVFAPEAVLGLVDVHWLPNPDRDLLSWRILGMGQQVPQDTAWVDRLERIVVRTDLVAWTVAEVASTVSAALPEEAPRLVAAWLWRQWRAFKAGSGDASGVVDESSVPGGEAATPRNVVVALLEGRELHDLTAIADAAPRQFIQEIWPLFIEMLEATSADAHPFVVGYRENHALIDDLDTDQDAPMERPLLAAIAFAIDAWAAAESEAFLQFVKANAERDLMRVQRLLTRGLVACAADHPDAALEYLCGDPRRLVLGPCSEYHRDSRVLIQIAAPHMDNVGYQRLEQTILSWHRYRDAPDDDAGTKRKRLQWDRQHRLPLLRALPHERTSPSTRRLVQEEERAFAHLEDRDIWTSGFGLIASPVSAEQMKKADDKDILKLFESLTDEHEWGHPRKWMKGGAVQAGQELARLAEVDPDRAVGLVRSLQPERNEIPVSEVLRTLVKTGYDRNAIYTLIEELAARGFSSGGFRHSSAHAVEQTVSKEYPIPEPLLSLLESWLASVEPESEDVVGGSTVGERNESVLWGGARMSFLPSGNFPVLAALCQACLVAEPPLVARWLSILEHHLSRTESPRVWRALGRRYLRWLNLAEPARAQTFLDSLFSAHPSVLGSIDGVHLMAYLQHCISPENARRWLELMAHAGGPGAQGSGELLMLPHALFPAEDWAHERVGVLLSTSAEVNSEQLVGLAHAVVHLWSDAQHRSLAHKYLVPLLASTDEVVLHAVGGILLSPTFWPDRPTRMLLDALCERPALLRDQRAQHLGEHLDTLADVEPERVARLAHALLDRAGDAMSNIAASRYVLSEHLLDVALRLQDMGEPHRTSGLTLFERMLEFNLPQANKMALSLDKRTFNASTVTRSP